MFKKLFFVFIAAQVLLSACASAKPTQPVASGPMEGCQVSNLIPEVNPTITALISAVKEEDHVLGNAQAKITILEYSDFQ